LKSSPPPSPGRGFPPNEPKPEPAVGLPLLAEPFRIFFPTGLLLGAVGVSLWLVFYLGLTRDYPNITHARLMIEGFMASFIFGFLGTAGPRLTSTPAFSFAELSILFTLDLLAAGLHLGGSHRAADVCFTLCLLFFAGVLVRRFRLRKDSPPPNFVLVALGILCGITGSALVASAETEQFSPAYRFGSALLNQGFVLLPICGVAPFFIRRLLDLPTPDLPSSREFPPGWRRLAAFAGLTGLAIIISFVIELSNWPRAGASLRMIALAVYLATQLPLRESSFLANSLRLGVLMIPLGFAVQAISPDNRLGALHIVFIMGFNFVTFTVAVRVIFGHSGNLSRLSRRQWFFILTGALLFLAMIARFSADVPPTSRIPHLISAAICWLLAALIWGVNVLPKVRVSEPE